MKKKILLIPIIILTVGCTNKEKLFEESAKSYYENYMKMVDDIDSVTITLEDLKNAESEQEYDLSKLKKCENNSKITFYINKSTKDIINTTIDLKC